MRTENKGSCGTCCTCLSFNWCTCEEIKATAIRWRTVQWFNCAYTFEGSWNALPGVGEDAEFLLARDDTWPDCIYHASSSSDPLATFQTGAFYDGRPVEWTGTLSCYFDGNPVFGHYLDPCTFHPEPIIIFVVTGSSVPAGFNAPFCYSQILSAQFNPLLLEYRTAHSNNIACPTGAGSATFVEIDWELTCNDPAPFAALASGQAPRSKLKGCQRKVSLNTLDCQYLDPLVFQNGGRGFRECLKGHGDICGCERPRKCGPGLCPDYLAPLVLK